MVTTANRDIEELNEPFRSNVKKALKELPNIIVTETYRSQERQAYLYTFGRSGDNINKKKVTWTLNSQHKSRLAIDVCFRTNPNYPNEEAAWRPVADVFNKHNITWGFDSWGKDKPHFQHSNTPLMASITKHLIKQAYQLILLAAKNLADIAQGDLEACADASAIANMCRKRLDK